jgi:hypothetical protein
MGIIVSNHHAIQFHSHPLMLQGGVYISQLSAGKQIIQENIRIIIYSLPMITMAISGTATASCHLTPAET